MSGISKRVYQNRRNVDIGGGVDKPGLPSTMGIPTMLRRFVASRAPNGVNNIPVPVPVNIPGPIWRQIAALRGDYPIPYPNKIFSKEVAISENYIVIVESTQLESVPFNTNIDTDYNMLDSVIFVYKINSDGTVIEIGRINYGINIIGFGTSLAISGNYFVVGSYNYSSNDEGAVYVFKINSDNTVTQIGGRFTGPNPQINSNFGGSVAISGNYFVVGAPLRDNNDGSGNANTNEGAVYVFKINSDNTFTQIGGRLAGPNPQTNSLFGFSVSISGNSTSGYYLVVGAPLRDNNDGSGNANTNEGAIYVYKINSDNTFTQIGGRFTGPNPQINSYFGFSVSISENYFVVGAPLRDNNDGNSNANTNEGAIYVYKINSDNTFTQIGGRFSDPDPQQDSQFGRSVAISGNYLVVGAPQRDSNDIGSAIGYRGGAYVYKINSNNTLSIGERFSVNVSIPEIYSANQMLGYSVAISGNYVIVSAPKTIVEGQEIYGIVYVLKIS